MLDRGWGRLQSEPWFLIPFLKRILSLQGPSRTADLRSVFSSALPEPLISRWILGRALPHAKPEDLTGLRVRGL